MKSLIKGYGRENIFGYTDLDDSVSLATKTKHRGPSSCTNNLQQAHTRGNPYVYIVNISLFPVTSQVHNAQVDEFHGKEVWKFRTHLRLNVNINMR
jgi:hypothetical protein